MLTIDNWDSLLPFLDDATVVKLKNYDDILDSWDYQDHETEIEVSLTNSEGLDVNIKDIMIDTYLTHGIRLSSHLGVTYYKPEKVDDVFNFLDGLKKFLHTDSGIRAELMDHYVNEEDGDVESVINILTEEFIINDSHKDFNYIIKGMSKGLIDYLLNISLHEIDSETFTKILKRINELNLIMIRDVSPSVRSHIFENGFNLTLKEYWGFVKRFSKDSSPIELAIDIFFVLNFASDTSILISDYIEIIEPEIDNKKMVRKLIIEMISKERK